MSSREPMTAVARVTEVIACSPISFDDAIRNGISRAAETLDNIAGAWVGDHQLELTDGVITAYKVVLKLTFSADP